MVFDFYTEVPVIYDDAFTHFGSAFEETANNLVPVDTGYLKSSIWVSPGDESIEMGADAEYADCVEFGTYKMADQPYFYPAIAAGTDAFMGPADEAINDAVEQAMEQYWEWVDECIEEAQEQCRDEHGGFLTADFAEQFTSEQFWGGVFGAMFTALNNIFFDMISGGHEINYNPH